MSQWFQNIYEAGWQTVEEILSTLGTSEPNLAYGSRSADRNIDGNSAAGVRRAKIIDLGLLLDAHRVFLVVTLMPEADGRTNINFRVYPASGQTCLPPNLQLIVLDESGETILEAQSRSADNSIQLGFRGDRGDCFSIKIALEDASVTEDFVI